MLLLADVVVRLVAAALPGCAHDAMLFSRPSAIVIAIASAAAVAIAFLIATAVLIATAACYCCSYCY